VLLSHAETDIWRWNALAPNCRRIFRPSLHILCSI